MILVILGHPCKRCVNHAIAACAIETLEAIGYEVLFHDLYRDGFDPVLPYREIPDDGPLDDTISDHCREVSRTEGFVIVHPNWWGQPPALLKGWVDRVMRPALRFLEGNEGEGAPDLRARFALVFNTSDTMPEREMEAFSDPLETIWKNCIFGLCGVVGGSPSHDLPPLSSQAARRPLAVRARACGRPHRRQGLAGDLAGATKICQASLLTASEDDDELPTRDLLPFVRPAGPACARVGGGLGHRAALRLRLRSRQGPWQPGKIPCCTAQGDGRSGVMRRREVGAVVRGFESRLL